MKFISLVLLVLLPLFCISQTTSNKIPENKTLHSSINATGGDTSSEEGSISYSIGQVFYSTLNEEKNYVIEGVQQPLIIYIRPIDKKEEVSFKVAAYPNPVTNYFKIEASDYSNRSLSYHLMDLNGRFLKKSQIEKTGAIVDISSLSSAIYLLIISDHGKKIKTIKIIKK